ncbi:MAG: formate dehydrogenase accessory protein FdhE [Burkholderiales bacterium]
MMSPLDRVKDLRRRYPEWTPWLAVIGALLEEIEDPSWDAAVPLGTLSQASTVPLLAKADLQVDERAASRTFEKLTRAAARSSVPQMASVRSASYAKLDVLRLFQAALNRDSEGLQEFASVAGADPDAFRAVAALAPMPFLHACNRHWASSLPESWVEGYCPICGAWPAFADVRGIERARYFRCGGCGAAWQAHCLFCPYCGTTDHEALGTLVPARSESNSAVDTCNGCRGYLKTFTTLQGSSPATVILDDLASVELDLAALERGYKRPSGAGYALDVTVTESTPVAVFARSD